MTKITVKVDGMMCGMCESHVNDAGYEVKAVSKEPYEKKGLFHR